MSLDRRDFLKSTGWGIAAGAGILHSETAEASHGQQVLDGDGVLVDLTQCVGCRLCEHECKKANGIEPGPLESYDDSSVCLTPRRPAPDAFTVVNATCLSIEQKPVYTKISCMHCQQPACVSACIVGALQKQRNGAVTYDAWKCIGCRYCMVACPFQIPAYEYESALTPRVRKCPLCVDRTREGKKPACVEACPQQALTFGKRSELLETAHAKIATHPERYIDHIYGEYEVGGTNVMYISAVGFEKLGFQKLRTEAPSTLTEKIQHGVFKHWIAPIGWYAFLAFMMWLTGRNEGGNKGDGVRYSKDSVPVISHPQPVKAKLLTPGVWTLLGLLCTGIAFFLYRFVFGLGAATNLDQQHPWGLWIAMDVGSGIALAGGGFVTAALVHIFHREHYHAVARSALLTALLGYTFYVPGLLADIGRWYNIWHPTLPSMWQGNSVLFEVGICVMLYLNVQYAELAPIICERFFGNGGRIGRWAKLLHRIFEAILPALLVAGVTLSTFHQSSLGNLMVIAPYKLHRLWWTPMSPLLFLLSAMMVGFPMVIFTMLFASWSLNRKPEMDVLSKLARYVPVFLAIYFVVKVGDIIARGVYPDLYSGQCEGVLWLIEIIVGVVVPLVMLLKSTVRNSPRPLAIAMLMVILGVVLNRLNCFVLAYHPPFATKTYFPSITEFAVSMGLVAALMLSYRVAVTYLPILEPRHEAMT